METRYFLENLSRHPEQAQEILKGATNSEIRSIVEIVYNFVKGNFKVCNKTKKKFKKFTESCRSVIKKISKKKRRKILQSGGFIITIAEVLLPIALQYLTKQYFAKE